MQSITEKKCTKCGIVKNLSEFCKGKDLLGLSYQCKDCKKSYSHNEKPKEFISEKVCPKCGILKLREEYNSDISKRYGLSTNCKECVAHYCKKWYEKPENFLKQKDTCKKYYLSKKEKWEVYQERKSERRKNDVALDEKLKAREHNNYVKRKTENPAKYKEITRKADKRWYEKNKEKSLLASKNRRVKTRGSNGVIALSEWQEICKFYGNKCLCCGRSDVKMTIDHIIPIFKNGKNVIENVQPLCHSCNSRKHTNTTDYRNGIYFRDMEL